ncbi:MAG: hypothetical protein DMG32_26155 [Acidobacteria bacterium]|nr:MAG: hypothetical protein DMG32_26155 [Acidobacteriota bacterium]
MTFASGPAVCALRTLFPFGPATALKVYEARDGIAAVERAREIKPDVVGTDIIMPNVSGMAAVYELLQVVPVHMIPGEARQLQAGDKLMFRKCHSVESEFRDEVVVEFVRLQDRKRGIVLLVTFCVSSIMKSVMVKGADVLGAVVKVAVEPERTTTTALPVTEAPPPPASYPPGGFWACASPPNNTSAKRRYARLIVKSWR